MTKLAQQGSVRLTNEEAPETLLSSFKKKKKDTLPAHMYNNLKCEEFHFQFFYVLNTQYYN